MRSILFLSVFITSIFTLTAQNRLPRSYVNLGLGAGVNYGIFGMKTVVGYKNSGLMLGIGLFPPNNIGYEIGGQYSHDWFYVNMGYAVVGIEQYGNQRPISIMGGNIMVGAMFSLGKKKRCYIDLGIGHTFGAPVRKYYIFNQYKEINYNTFTPSVGFSYRFGGKEAKPIQ